MHNFSFVIPGKLAGMACPRRGEAFTDDLIDLAREGVRAVVTLTESPPEAERLEAAGFAWLHVPIDDFTAPTPAQIERVVGFVREQNDAGRAVVLHCMAGHGRTGTLLACCLVAFGMAADQAVAKVRQLRPGSIETPEQIQSVRFYASRVAAAGQ